MGNNWAILIGINYYQHHLERQLNYAVKDAQLMYDFLYNFGQFPREHLILCLGDKVHLNNKNYPLCSNILKLLTRDLNPNRTGKVDRLWFFFAGHGISKNGKDYLITSDSLLEDIDLRIALAVNEVIACLRKHQDAEIVLILDCCRQIVGSRYFGNAIREKNLGLTKNSGITTIFSCEYGEFSHELDNKKHGSFTYSLVEGLKQHTLPVQLEKYLQLHVPNLNAEDGKSINQTPRIRIDSISKIHDFLLPECATISDINEIIKIAKNEELKKCFEEAKSLYQKVIEVPRSEEEIISAKELAKKAIERIEKNTNQILKQDDFQKSSRENKKQNSLEPIPNLNNIEDMNPDEWINQRKFRIPSLWNKIIRFIFDEDD